MFSLWWKNTQICTYVYTLRDLHGTFYLDGWRNANVWSTVASRLAADWLALCPCAVFFFFSFLFLFFCGCSESLKYTESLRLQSLSSPLAGPSIMYYQRPRGTVCSSVKHTPGKEPSRTLKLLIDSRLEQFCPPKDSQNGYQCLVKWNIFKFFCVNFVWAFSWLTVPFLDHGEKKDKKQTKYSNEIDDSWLIDYWIFWFKTWNSHQIPHYLLN